MPTIRTVFLFGAATFASWREEPQLTVSQSGEVAIPEEGFFGGSVMVYTDGPPGAAPDELGCELFDEDGDPVSLFPRVGSLDHVLRDPATVDGTTWYPFTEVDLASVPATLQCPGDVLSPAGVSEPSTFGGASALVSWTAFGFGLIAVSMGAVTLLILRLTRR